MVSIILVTHNNEGDISECIRSIFEQTYTNFEIIIVDNNSSDRTTNIIKENFQEKNLSLLESRENLFYAGGNNLGYKKARGDIIAILNPDLIVDKSWLQEILAATKRYPDAGILCADVLLYDDRSKINACGNAMHLSGLVFSRFYGRKECDCKEEPILVPSGAAFVFNKKTIKDLGQSVPFNEEQLPMEFSDIDLALRVLSNGRDCIIIPSSKVYHKYKFKMDSKKFEYLEKCRYQVISSHITRRTRLSMLPIFFATELLSLSFAAKNGFLARKILLYFWLLGLHKVPAGKNSTEKDYKIISRMSPEIEIYQEFNLDSKDAKFLSKFNSFFQSQHKKILARLSQKH